MQTRYNSEARRASLQVRTLTKAALSVVLLSLLSASALADQLKLADGSTMQVDEAWEDAAGVWYRRAGVTHWVERSRVKQVIKAGHEAEAAQAEEAEAKKTAARSSPKSKGRRGRGRFVEPEPEPILYKETQAGEPAWR